MKIIHTSTKRKKPSKPTAEQRKLAAEWEALQRKHSKPLEKGTQGKATVKPPKEKLMPLDTPIGRFSTKGIPSRVTPGGNTAKSADKQYTGTAIIGIGQMAKSNAVPVFSKEEAVDIARMRRN